ncbi:MAG TPA: ABC transporter permease subunit [Bacilli bacterium]|jgi:arabinogalactan oligomer/maltooligosaccharide transport system permease protein|nr:ABC transporter permease subunit [Bacilli bacterium]HPK58975.1 ABC transporter permease subunit [Bacilli bacterium]
MKNIRIILIKIATQIFLLLLALITLLPFVYIILISFGKNVISAGAKIPKEFTFDNYKELFQATKFLNWLSNSLIIGLGTMVITVILVSVTVYVFSRLRFLGKEKLFNFLLLIQIFPLTLSMVSIFRIFVAIGLLNKMPGLIIIDSTLASAGLVMIAKGYFDTIPYDLDEAAVMDGATKLQILWKITLPLAKPMLAIVAIQSFVIAYNEYVIASAVMTTNILSMPLSVGLQSMIVGQFGINWSIYCAGAILGSIPMIILFYSLQKYFIGGLTEGGVKQ